MFRACNFAVDLQPGLCGAAGKCAVQSVTRNPKYDSQSQAGLCSFSRPMSFVEPNYFPFPSSDALFMLFQYSFTLEKGIGFPHFIVNIVRKLLRHYSSPSLAVTR